MKDSKDDKMRIIRTSLVAACVLVGTSAANASEYGFSTYGLGSNAFGAGVTPPPGTYVSTAFGFYSGTIGGTVNFGGTILNAGAKVQFLSAAENGLYVPDMDVFGGHLGLSVTVPVGQIELRANVGPVAASTDGGGLGDITSKLQLGWTEGAFSQTFYVQAVAPTGRYAVGFSPNIGLNRPGIDTGWAFTYVDTRSKLQFNGTAGVTFNFENTATDYQSGDEFHFEWATGYQLSPALVVGVAGYDYRQLTGDSGTGAKLGSFMGSVDAIGPALSYTTLIGKTPLIVSLRDYQEFNAENRFQGNTAIGTATVRF